MNEYFILFANCIPVQGKKISIICDLQNHNYVEIPNLLCEILTINREENLTLEALKKRFNNDQDEGIDLFFNYLKEKGLGFYSKKKDAFPALDTTWNYPGQISNSIIEVSDKLIPFWQNIVDELSNFNCFAIELRIMEQASLKFLNQILNAFAQSSIRFILLIIPYSERISFEDLELIIEKHPRCANILIHSSSKNESTKKIVHVKENLTDRTMCGLINPNSFVINIKSFSEAINHNSCLNRKIAIDKEGEIKNCPSMPNSFGNIRDTSLLHVLNNPEFKTPWNLKKDDIQVCKDCQFRYICMDCRAYVEAPNDIKSKPLKCGYDPYTGEWADWSTNPLKKQAIISYQMEF